MKSILTDYEQIQLRENLERKSITFSIPEMNRCSELELIHNFKERRDREKEILTNRSIEDILNHLKTLEAAKIHYPERTIFVSEIPLTAAGKADKKILKKDIEKKLKAESG